MITFTKWTVMLIISYLITLLLYDILPSESLTMQIIILIINVIICTFLWTFVHWNIQSDENLGIKPGIELF